MLTFNYGLIKRLAKPGSWRRGYGYFRANKVQQLQLCDTGVFAQVKGNYKEAYDVHLDFAPTVVYARCSCPLEEEWCKHAVVVALESVEKRLWEAFWNLPPEEDTPAEVDWTAYDGQYIVYFEPNFRTKNAVGIRFVERRTGKVVSHLEPILRGALNLQNKADVFNDAEKREMSLMQYPLKQGQSRSKDGWYPIALGEVDHLLKVLPALEDCRTADERRWIFEADPMRLLMGVNVSMAGNVLVSLHWVHPATETRAEDAYPLEEIRLLNKDLPWGFRQNHIYPLAHLLKHLPNHLTKGSFTDIKDADGGKFMYEELPRLRRWVDVDEAEILEQLHLQKKPPGKILTLSTPTRMDAEYLQDPSHLRLRAMLDFSYDGEMVPYSKASPESPYVMVLKKASETIYWVKRDVKAEQAAYKHLLDGGLEPIQANFLQAEGDHAIDVVNHLLPALDTGWTLKTDDDLTPLKAAQHPLKIRASIEFDPDSVAHFRLAIDCVVGDVPLGLDVAQRYLVSGRKYFFLENAGFVEIPLADILQFSKTIQAFDAEKLSELCTENQDVYRVQTYKAGLIAELVDQGVLLNLSPRFQQFWNLVSAFNTLQEIPVPALVQANLRPYQKQGYNWLWFLYTYGLNGILADDMGLGKTLQTLTMLQRAKLECAKAEKTGADQAKEPRPSLIICPTSVVYNWVDEAIRFTPDLDVIDLTGPNRHGQYKKIKDADLVITSYGLLRRDINALKNYPFKYVILDESQNIKNVSSQTTQATKVLQCRHRLALSGTPIENRLSELWSVFDFLMPGFLYDFDEFRYRCITPIEEKGNHDAERRLKKQVAPFILRRLKRDVAADLPPKVENVHFCEMTDAQRKLYLKILEETRNEVFAHVSGDKIKSPTHIFGALLRLRQVCCDPRLLGPELSGGVTESGKFEAFQELLEEILSEGHRVLVFSQFVEMLKLVRKWVEVKGIPFEYLTGDTPAPQRKHAVARFNNDEKVPLFLVSLKAGGTGLNLTGADYVIHYDPWWNPAAEDQATDRAHRIGQTKSVFVYRLIAKGTVEEKILQLQAKKRDLVDAILTTNRSMGKLLTFEDLKEILTPGF